MFLKHLTIGKKIAGAFSIIAMMILLFSFFLHNELTNINSNLLNYTDDSLPASEQVDSIHDQIANLRRSQFLVFIMEGSKETIAQKINQNKEIRKNIEAELRAYGQTVWPGEEEESYKRLMSGWQRYINNIDNFNSAMLLNNKRAARSILLTDSYPSFKIIETEVSALTDILKQAMNSNRVQILDSISRLSQMSIYSNLGIFVFMIGITLLLSKLICGPLSLIVRQANAIAKGDLSTQLDREAIGNDELGSLADASSQMQNNLRQLIDEIISAVTQLSSAVEEMTHISDTSTKGMHDQQHQIAQIAAAMTEMKASVADVAYNTEHSASQASEANQQAKDGAKDNKAMVDSIKEIAGVIDDAGNTVSALEEQSHQINIIVDVIRGIADQTNLLALNAAIEAARAGESGRGFAVVADEVRTLAGRTQDSTGEITAVIEKLQVLAKHAKVATVKSCECIETYSEQGHRSLQLMNSIEHSVSNISDMGTQIASACSQQGSVAEDLSRHIETIHVASQEVAEGSKQTALACNELSQLSSSLHEAMNRFKLN
ncbi:methyl-accepting chemotaxis protein [Photobacterium profundum]|uniref:Methyl-accepting chemotaxis protein n=1 Tax=Photobacterium profundum (strain SS9) TaxID=298386 RepID=Q6LFY4_PHOPR|nr:methyl-accepting chemotaxis protein [Photobacterium profundum]CAG23796.1 putative methyl-accepting chemotaxis protein [Photobacterium profundum SS9]